MARFKKYKLATDFNEWRKDNPNTEIYAITTYGGEVLFDVTEEDFIKMVDKGIVNGEGNYFLLGHHTEQSMAELAEMYGILWTDKERYVYVLSVTATDKGNNDGILVEAYSTMEKAKTALLEWKVETLKTMLSDTHTKWDITTNEDDCFNAYGTNSAEDNVYAKIDKLIVN